MTKRSNRTRGRNTGSRRVKAHRGRVGPGSRAYTVRSEMLADPGVTRTVPVVRKSRRGNPEIAPIPPTGPLFVFDASDTTEMFEDIGGTIPVSNFGPVGRWKGLQAPNNGQRPAYFVDPAVGNNLGVVICDSLNSHVMDGLVPTTAPTNEWTWVGAIGVFGTKANAGLVAQYDPAQNDAADDLNCFAILQEDISFNDVIRPRHQTTVTTDYVVDQFRLDVFTFTVNDIGTALFTKNNEPPVQVAYDPQPFDSPRMLIGAKWAGGMIADFGETIIGELQFYPYTLSEDDRETLINQLITKWGIT